jgi:tetratricopeptide (TPR) repeat protein
MARREERENLRYLSDEQRSQAGCPADKALYFRRVRATRISGDAAVPRPTRSKHRRSSPAPAASGARTSRLWPALILVAGLVTYANGLTNPFIFDDFGSVVRNESIRDLADLGSVLTPPTETSVARRPLVNLSFAVNYAFGGLNVVGYRVVNLALHLACALLIFGLVRRTLDAVWSGDVSAAASPRARALAGATALVWVVHPLNSEVVDYVSERSDSMMTLCYLGALYASLRAHQSPRPSHWRVAAVGLCAAGMGCKESMVTAPVMIALYDGVYVSGASVRAIAGALRVRWRFYAALAATWAFLVPSLIASASISTGGFSSAHTTWWTYLLNQAEMVTRYLRLALWPSSLVNFYGWTRPYTLADVWIPAAFLTVLVLASILWFLKAPRAGFLAVSVFILLAPTSSIVPIAAEVGAERRMYLPLVCIVILVMLAADALWRRFGAEADASRAPARPFLWVVGAVVAVLAVVTIGRNREYASALTMARTVLARWPTPMAHHLVGAELAFAGRRDEAIAELAIAAPGYAPARYYLGLELGAAGRFDEAVAALQSFIRDEPRAPVVPSAHGLIADALVRLERPAEAIPHYRVWLDANPANHSDWSSLGRALFSAGRAGEAAEAFGRAVAASPATGHYHQNLALALLETARVGEAASHAQQAVALLPAEPGSHNVLARVFAAQGKIDDALREFRRALEIDPAYAPARDGLRALGHER